MTTNKEKSDVSGRLGRLRIPHLIWLLGAAFLGWLASFLLSFGDRQRLCSTVFGIMLCLYFLHRTYLYQFIGDEKDRKLKDCICAIVLFFSTPVVWLVLLPITPATLDLRWLNSASYITALVLMCCSYAVRWYGPFNRD
jgi:hypothetical protein